MPRPRRLPKVLTPDEQALLLRQFNKRYPSALRNLVAVQLMLYCGLRCGEVVAIRPEHVDLDTCRLLVRDGKGGKDRVVWFSDDLRDLIVRWLERCPRSAWLLCTRHATQLSTRYLRELVKRKAVASGLADGTRVTPHTLRHTFATDLLRETKNIRLTQKALGHASLTTTMIYTHVADEELERALRRRRGALLVTPRKQPQRHAHGFVRRPPEGSATLSLQVPRKQGPQGIVFSASRDPPLWGERAATVSRAREKTAAAWLP